MPSRPLVSAWMCWLVSLCVGLLGTAAGLVLLVGLHSVMA